MTKQEAVEVIKDFVAYGEHVNAFVYKGSTSIPIEALNMAIKALDQEPSCRNPRQVDLISRQDAIKVIEKCKAELTKPGDGLLYAKLKRLINECPNGE